MTMFALPPSRITIVSIDLRCTTPVPPIAIGRPASSPLDRLPKQAFNTLRQYAAGAEIPIASDARPLHTSRGFLPWRFAYAGPRVRRATIMGPASANLHNSGSELAVKRMVSIADSPWSLFLQFAACKPCFLCEPKQRNPQEQRGQKNKIPAP